MAMIGLLYALPNTQLTRRLELEGRLFRHASKTINEKDIDQTTSGLNFKTLIPRRQVLSNFVRVIQHVYERVAACGSISRVIVATDDRRIADA
jgi:hypothetical protein